MSKKIKPPPDPMICLGMIVKNEEDVLPRCLNSLEMSINAVRIHDTGSTDGTLEQINLYCNYFGFSDVITQVAWENFGKNRSQVLQHIRNQLDVDFTFMLDADEELVGNLKDALVRAYERDNRWHDTYQIEVRLGTIVYKRNFVFSNAKPWRFEGVIHEYPECDEPFTTGILEGIHILSHHDGARSKNPNKYKDDVELFSTIDDVKTPRETFYFAQSLRDAGIAWSASVQYDKRTQMGGYEEEIFYSHFMLGKLTDSPLHYFAAYNMRPNRAEPLFYLAKSLMDKNQWNAAVMLLKDIWCDDPPRDGLFIETDIYGYRVAMEYAVAQHYAGNFEQAVSANELLLAQFQMPKSSREQVQKNLKFSQEALENAK